MIPFGSNLNGISWIDPAGVDITTGGVPTKQINISSANVDDQIGSSFNIAGRQIVRISILVGHWGDE